MIGNSVDCTSVGSDRFWGETAKSAPH